MSKDLKTPREIIKAQLAGKVVQQFSPQVEGGIWEDRETMYSCTQEVLDFMVEGFRIKPKVRVIHECNGYKLYPCVTEPLKEGQEYYMPAPTNENLYEKRFWWGSESNRYHLRCGFVYLNREHARYHGDAMCHTCEVEEEIEDEPRGNGGIKC